MIAIHFHRSITELEAPMPMVQQKFETLMRNLDVDTETASYFLRIETGW